MSKNLKNQATQSISLRRKLARSQHWKKQAMLEKTISERADVFIAQKDTTIIRLETTHGAKSFSAIVNSKGVIIIK